MTDYLEAAAGENADVLLEAELRLAGAMAGLGRRTAGKNGQAPEETELLPSDGPAGWSGLPGKNELPVLIGQPVERVARFLEEGAGAAAEETRKTETAGETGLSAAEARPAETARAPERPWGAEGAQEQGKPLMAEDLRAAEAPPMAEELQEAEASREPGEYPNQPPLAAELERLEAALAGGLQIRTAELEYADGGQNRTFNRAVGTAGHGGRTGAAGGSLAGADRAYPRMGAADGPAGGRGLERASSAGEIAPVEQLDRRLRRDSRRYDGGFFLY